MKNLNENNFMRAIIMKPRMVYELGKQLGVAMEANRVYEMVSMRPEQQLVKESKYGILCKKANVIVGIVSAMQKETGLVIIPEYMKGTEEKISFVYDLDDFFNELYVEKVG